MNNEIFKAVLGSLIRHFLTLVFTLLGSYGVSEAMQGQLTDALVPLLVSALFGIGIILWSYLQKRFQIVAKFEAANAEQGTRMSLIESDAAQKATQVKF